MIGILAQASSGTQSGSGLTFLVPLVLMGGVMYFIMIRPQRRRAQQQRALLSSLEVGDEIMTTAGILGTITDIDEDEGIVTVEIAPGTRIRMIRAGVARKLVEDEDYADDDADEDAGAGGSS